MPRPRSRGSRDGRSQRGYPASLPPTRSPEAFYVHGEMLGSKGTLREMAPMICPGSRIAVRFKRAFHATAGRDNLRIGRSSFRQFGDASLRKGFLYLLDVRQVGSSRLADAHRISAGKAPRTSRLDERREECTRRFTDLVAALRMPLHCNHELPRFDALQGFDHPIYGADRRNHELLPSTVDCLVMTRVHREPQLFLPIPLRQIRKSANRASPGPGERLAPSVRAHD